MAVTIDSSSSNSVYNSTMTLTHTVNSGTTALLVAASFNASGGSYSGCTWNGTGMTQIYNTTLTGQNSVAFWILLNPTAGASGSIVLSGGTATMTAVGLGFKGSDTSTGYIARGSITTSGANPSITSTSGTSTTSICVAAFCGNQMSAGNGSVYGATLSGYMETIAGSSPTTTLSGTAASGNWSAAMVEIIAPLGNNVCSLN